MIFIIGSKASAQSKISGIEARLFYNQKSDQDNSPVDKVSGTFSKQDITTGKVALWNTIIGEGGAEGPSNQTIVIVGVKSGKYSNKRQTLRFTASVEKKIIHRELQTFSVIGDNENYKLLFLLNDTGCSNVIINAELLIKGKVVSTLSKSIHFECGE
ncbi:hypothetical protein [uncultured Mucilaginibacter sp.]|uniref:hypothetical protein n=1 Tax=uncultured Mucilaginibacter sp. TaxID=797541 RepID=UPI0025EB2DAD|nr:hypothetical protein [uncultured Mucilaginibacter sp.]